MSDSVRECMRTRVCVGEWLWTGSTEGLTLLMLWRCLLGLNLDDQNGVLGFIVRVYFPDMLRSH